MSVSPPTARPSLREAVRRRIRLLVVDDSLDHRALISRRLETAGMQVRTAASALETLEQLDDVDLVLLDYRLPDVEGLELLRLIRDRRNPPSVIMVTGAGSTEVAVEAMRAGAINYVSKDHGYVETLPEVVERAWRHHDLDARATELHRLALLVTSATDRDQLFHEIMDGATRLLHAQSCALLVEEDGRLRAVAGLGPDRDELSSMIVISLVEEEASLEPRVVDGHLLVPLPSGTGEPVGLLALMGPSATFDAEDLELSKAFASFAGIALRKLRQFELERVLVTELQQTLDARRDFVASISHELRTPLTAISGFTQTLQMHWEQLDEPQQRRLLERVDRNADELRALVDELLDLARLERGRVERLQLEHLDIAVESLRVVDQLGHVLEHRDVRVEVPHLLVLADASLLRRTLGNLLSNAVKFSDVGTAIEVRARPAGEYVEVEVADHGVGLPPWEVSRVFDPFFRARSSVANAVRGTGIGLALVREYVRSMDGEVSLTSEPGAGSVFGFTLPAAAPGDTGGDPSG
jgi:signal transduction histidine kinase/FixJ family two-component response regulator